MEISMTKFEVGISSRWLGAPLKDGFKAATL